MKDLIFVRFAVKQEDKEDDEPLAVYCSSLGSLNMGTSIARSQVFLVLSTHIELSNIGYRHLPLHDAQLSQYLFSTLFVKIGIRDVQT